MANKDPRKEQPTERELKAAVIIGEYAERDPKSDFPSELAFQAELRGLLKDSAKQVKELLYKMVIASEGEYTLEKAQQIAEAAEAGMLEAVADDDDDPPQPPAELPSFQYEAFVKNPDLSKLFQYLPQSDIEWRQGASHNDKVQMLPYVDARAVIRILNETFGLFGWRQEYTPIKDGYICRLWVFFDGEWHFKEDGASETNIESIKGGISGSLKRAAAVWGIAQYLYYSDAVWVPGIRDKNGTLRPDWQQARGKLVVTIDGKKVGK